MIDIRGSWAKDPFGNPVPLTAPIKICDYNPVWPDQYRAEEARIRTVLGDRVIRIEHAGSTSVPGLPAKPIIDIVLEVADSSDEAAYLPDMATAGYRLRIREPDWFEHRLFKGPDIDLNIHVFSLGCPEVHRMLLFRDWLRRDKADRELYAGAKRELAAHDWKYMQQYADSKSAAVLAILSRATGPSLARRLGVGKDTAAGVARPQPQALESGYLQVVERSALRGEAGRRGGAGDASVRY